VDCGYLNAESIELHGLEEATRRAYTLWGWEMKYFPACRDYLLVLMRYRFSDRTTDAFYRALPTAQQGQELTALIDVDAWENLVARHVSELGVGQVVERLHAVGKLAERRNPDLDTSGDPLAELESERAKELPNWLRKLDRIPFDNRLWLLEHEPDMYRAAPLLQRMHEATGVATDDLWAGIKMKAAQATSDAIARSEAAFEKKDWDEWSVAANRTSLMQSLDREIKSAVEERRANDWESLRTSRDRQIESLTVNIERAAEKVGTIGARPAADVLRERLEAIPPTELALIAMLNKDAYSNTPWKDWARQVAAIEVDAAEA